MLLVSSEFLARRVAQHSIMHRTASNSQALCDPQMSLMPRLRNPGLKEANPKGQLGDGEAAGLHGQGQSWREPGRGSTVTVQSPPLHSCMSSGNDYTFLSLSFFICKTWVLTTAQVFARVKEHVGHKARLSRHSTKSTSLPFSGSR